MTTPEDNENGHHVQNDSQGCKIKAGSHDAIFRANYLFRFKEVSDANQHFYELKQCQISNLIQKMDCVNRPLDLKNFILISCGVTELLRKVLQGDGVR